MEERDDLRSILPLLPLVLRSSSLFWPPKAMEALKALASGPELSGVASGVELFNAILELRVSLGLYRECLASRAADGYVLYFDELISGMNARMWFGEVIPNLAKLLLRLPSLLEAHYQHADDKLEGMRAGLRILGHQEAGIVFLSQELIAALLVCALFCLFPTSGRSGTDLPSINFDCLFAALHPNAKQSQEQKINCLIHYFEKICLHMPTDFVSFERKVLPWEYGSCCITYPEAVFWKNSTISLCSFEVFQSGSIEDQQHEALEVDFANEYLGGGALHRGCVQEEIRFMINPELIVGMLFMASMRDNESIEVIGVERFSSYLGYGSSFQYVGDYLDRKPLDEMGRRRTRIVAIDALCSPGLRQYAVPCLVRETNKAFCGFLDQSKCQYYLKIYEQFVFLKEYPCHTTKEVCSGTHGIPSDNNPKPGCPDLSTSTATKHVDNLALLGKIDYNTDNSFLDPHDKIGIATGNWGCGAFGGDPQIKSIIQWLAASQALRPFVHYYTFGEPTVQRLEQVTQWVLSHGWKVGDLWSMMLEYSAQRLNTEINMGFFDWLLPVVHNDPVNEDNYMSE